MVSILWFPKQTAIPSLRISKYLTFLILVEFVYCAVRGVNWNILQLSGRFYRPCHGSSCQSPACHRGVPIRS